MMWIFSDWSLNNYVAVLLMVAASVSIHWILCSPEDNKLPTKTSRILFDIALVLFIILMIIIVNAGAGPAE